MITPPISDEDLKRVKDSVAIRRKNDTAGIVTGWLEQCIARIEQQETNLKAYRTKLAECGEQCERQQAEIERLRKTSMDLLSRLDEWTPDGLTDENAREWLGHVEPFQERLRMIVTRAALKQEVSR